MFVGEKSTTGAPAKLPPHAFLNAGTSGLMGYIAKCNLLDRSNVGEPPMLTLERPAVIFDTLTCVERHAGQNEGMALLTCNMSWSACPGAFGTA